MSRNLWLLLTLLLLSFTLNVSGITAVGGITTQRISVNAANTEGNLGSLFPFMSANERYVVFMSVATNWVPEDTNGSYDIFLKDRLTNALDLVSRTTTGGIANGPSRYPSVSANGRFVVFDSSASNLVPNDTNGVTDVFIRDRQLGTTTRISQDPVTGATWNAESSQSRISDDGRWVVFRTEFAYAAEDTNSFFDVYVWDRLNLGITLLSQHQGQAGNGESTVPDVSADGRYIVFQSRAQNFPGNDTNPLPDIYLIDRQDGIMERISFTSGTNGSEFTVDPRVSNDGRYVTFWGPASTLIPGDTNNVSDIFVVDRVLDTTTRVSEGPNGEQSTLASEYPDISGDGSTVAYSSRSNVFVPGDTNNEYDVFLYDIQTGITSRASVSETGAEGDNNSERASLPTSGTIVAFHSEATNLVAGDTNIATDVFVRGDPTLPNEPTPTVTPSATAGTPQPPTFTSTPLPVTNTPTVTTVATNTSTATTLPTGTPTATGIPTGTPTVTNIPTNTATATNIPTASTTATAIPSTLTPTSIPPTAPPSSTPGVTLTGTPPASTVTPTGTANSDKLLYLPLIRADN